MRTSTRSLDLDLASGDLLSDVRIDEKDIPLASLHLLRLAKRSRCKYVIAELQDLFDMLSLDMTGLPRRPDPAARETS